MKRRKLTLDLFARLDIDEVSYWYESFSLRLRKRFTRALLSMFSLIEEFPFRYPVLTEDFRKAVSTEFPYMVIYRVTPDEIVVYAVMHTSRDPTAWLDRLQLQ